MTATSLSSGLLGLDRILKGFLPGDNIVWQVPSIDEYRRYVIPYARYAADRGQRLVYFRFASHEALLAESDFPSVQILSPDPALGFESFISTIHSAIKQNGRGGYYVFDSLSELTLQWYSDRMLGNFFMLTCPYLLDMEALAYFAVIKREHSHNALSPIHETAQVVIDVYRSGESLYLHPLKVQLRYSPTMHMLHREEGESFVPVTNSAVNSDILSVTPFHSGADTFEEIDMWNRIFSKARDALETPSRGEEREDLKDLLLKMTVTRDEKILELAKRFLTLADLVEVGRRMIGTGLIGGKSTGMLIARAILEHGDGEVARHLEIHDSFFLGSDVYYTYMVVNGCWWIRHQQKDIESFLSVAEYARRVILTGKFPSKAVRKLSDMLDYFGQSPIIVRSSSLLEDNFGNAFSGKYESVFCPNQGSREARLENLITAIKTIYASTLSEKALRYRSQLGILDKDEQMPLLIQRVSGDLHGKYFYPAAAGVGYSWNPYVWDSSIDPDSGVLRIVYGMGTRAVDRSDGDYTRIASLGAPLKRPETGIDEIRRYSQRSVDLIDLEANQLVAVDFDDLAECAFAAESRYLMGLDPNSKSRFISFDSLFRNTGFVDAMKRILRTLEKAYTYPVDIEFTLNFTGDDSWKVNIVQCRPFEARKDGNTRLDISAYLDDKAVLSSTCGTVIGRSRVIECDRIIYVPGAAYDALPVSQKYQTARTIGKIMKKTAAGEKVVLIGPGRWGTTTVFLGIPVTFAEISRAECILEVVEMGDNFIPDVSLGTHFFNDLVELDILYLAHYPQKEGTVSCLDRLLEIPNALPSILDDAESLGLAEVIRVIECAPAAVGPDRISSDRIGPAKIGLAADIVSQTWALRLT